jgi:aminotransferase
MVSSLRAAGLEPCVPHGAYYVLADVTNVPGSTSAEKALYVLREKKVASVPGSSFYANGGGVDLTRFCFAKRDEVLNEACERLK